MLPKINRLPLRHQKAHLEQNGLSFSTPTLTAIIARSDSDLPVRFALIVSKKISNKAVSRNKLRRRVFNTLHPYLSRLKPNYDILLLAKHPLLDADIPTITTDLESLLIQGNLLNS